MFSNLSVRFLQRLHCHSSSWKWTEGQEQFSLNKSGKKSLLRLQRTGQPSSALNCSVRPCCSRPTKKFHVPFEILGKNPKRLHASHHRTWKVLAATTPDTNAGSEGDAKRFAPKVKAWAAKVSYCADCGGAMEQRIPEGEAAPRAVCTSCGKIHYLNPKMVVVCLVEHEGQVLLCRRKIDPCAGLWTLPGGYMELGESAPEGAARETWEEAHADVAITAPFAHLDIPLIGQSYIIFRGQLRVPGFAPGPESLEVSLFKLDKIPFDSLAFSAIRVALEKYVEDTKQGLVRMHLGVIEKRPGALPSDPTGFELRDHIAMPLQCNPQSTGSVLNP